MFFFSLLSSVQTIPAGLYTARTVFSVLLLTTFFPTRTSCPSSTFMPGAAVFPSTVTIPDSISLSASLLEQTPASLKYLFSLIILQYPADTVILHKCITVIQEQNTCDLIFLHNFSDIIIIISWINHYDFSVICRQKRNYTIRIGIFYKQQSVCCICRRSDIQNGIITAKK